MKPMSTSTPEVEELAEIIRSIVDTVAPEKIILFGSGARGQMDEDSDIDLLVVKDGCHRIHTAGDIYAGLPTRSTPVDIVVVWPEELVAYRDAPWGVIPPALREGKTVYAKDPQTPQG